MNETEYSSFLSLCLALATMLLSIGISMFTLSVAFIDGKKQELSSTYDKVEQGGVSLSLSRKIKSLILFIQTMIFIANKAIWIVILSFFTILIVIIFMNIDVKIWAYLICVPLIASILITVRSLWKLFIWYKRDNKI
ncbi:hypothetical protein NG821_04345 [Prevotella cerevisiae]|jgi:hypothetical protein|uniref:Uncharacterized protein n=1 Tax=Segatella cerevisiae TaxID=2053716 RepID=A0ABT1BW79_9BACT|nr:hypothetical protein [Segatella cerevisiae]MCH3993581.1 hypothetical protein [Prevotella sp.]MCO6025075.1 hypothetical protein [Segatella cerevisiae]